MVDAFCQYHDMEYAYGPSSLEIEDDKQFKHMLHQWSSAAIGDGWNGPTVFERNIIIPLILEAFHSKDINNEPWAKMIIPSNLMHLMTQFKTYSENYKDDGQDWKKLKWAKENPQTAAENMLELLYRNASYRKGEHVIQADKAVVAVQNKCTKAESKPLETIPEYIYAST